MIHFVYNNILWILFSELNDFFLALLSTVNKLFGFIMHDWLSKYVGDETHLAAVRSEYNSPNMFSIFFWNHGFVKIPFLLDKLPLRPTLQCYNSYAEPQTSKQDCTSSIKCISSRRDPSIYRCETMHAKRFSNLTQTNRPLSFPFSGVEGMEGRLFQIHETFASISITPKYSSRTWRWVCTENYK